jgi:hypothetical protein
MSALTLTFTTGMIYHGNDLTQDENGCPRAWLRGKVDGEPAAMPLRPGLAMWTNEDADIYDLPSNAPATLLARRLRAIGPDDVLRGTAVITGQDEDGAAAPLAEVQLHTLYRQLADALKPTPAAAH